jgi:hypothetical protein
VGSDEPPLRQDCRDPEEVSGVNGT